MKNQNNNAKKNTSFGMIRKVTFHPPMTIVHWKDGTVTTVGDGSTNFTAEEGIAIAYMKKAEGNRGNFNNIFRTFEKDMAKADDQWSKKNAPIQAKVSVKMESKSRRNK